MSLNLNGLGGLDLIRAVPRNLSREQARDLIRQGLDAIPAIADRIQRAGYVRLPNGQWGTQEEYNRARADIRRRGREAEARAEPGDPRDWRMRFNDFVSQNVNTGELARTVRQIYDYQPNPFLQFGINGLNYAMGGFSEQNPILGLLFNSVISGGAAGLSTSNPWVGLGVAAKNIVSGAYDAWKKHRENSANEEHGAGDVIYYDEEDDSLPDSDLILDRNRSVGRESERIRNREIVRDIIEWNDREIAGNLPSGNESRVEVERERREIEKNIEKAKALQDPVRFFNNLRIERVANFSITPPAGAKVVAKSKKLRSFDFLRNYAPLSSVFGMV